MVTQVLQHLLNAVVHHTSSTEIKPVTDINFLKLYILMAVNNSTKV